MRTSPEANNKIKPVQIRHSSTDHTLSQKSRQHKPVQYNPRISDWLCVLLTNWLLMDEVESCIYLLHVSRLETIILYYIVILIQNISKTIVQYLYYEKKKTNPFVWFRWMGWSIIYILVYVLCHIFWLIDWR